MLEQERNVVVLDAGNVFLTPGRHGRMKAETAVEGMQVMVYRMFNLGHQDFVHGLNFLLDTTARFGLPTVNANVVYADTGETVTEPYRIITAGPIKIGFVGIVARKYEYEIQNALLETEHAVEVLDERTTLQRTIDSLKHVVDVVVVLASVGINESVAIAKEVHGVDVVICSGGDEATQDVLYYDGVYVVKSGSCGKYTGNLTLHFGIAANIVDAEFRLVALDAAFPDDPEMEALLATYHMGLTELKDELRGLEQQTPDRGLFYTGAAACTACHQRQAGQWSTADHASAFASLEESDQIDNGECFACHTTGWGYTGGFIIADDTPEMEDVQCEMCHGPGGEHVETPGRTFDAVSETTCIKCHTEVNSPNFDYAACYPRIVH